MENKSPIFCSLAFGSISIGPNGKYQPCCSSIGWENKGPLSNTNPIENINHPDLVQIRELLNKGEWPNSCINCKSYEQSGGYSMRNSWNKELRSCNISSENIIDPLNIYRLDISLGSKCNSKCMTCHPFASSLWNAEWEYIHGGKLQNNRVTSYEELEALANSFPNVRSIGFLGGEPTIIDEHLSFLKLLIDKGRSKNITIGYVTNLIGLSDELIELWKNFKEVHVAVSIDGYKEVNDYIRYPVTWPKVEKNLRRYLTLAEGNPDQFRIGLSATLSVFNCRNFSDLLYFWCNITGEYNICSSVTMNRASLPPHTDILLLSKEYREPEIEKIKTLKQIYERRKDKLFFNSFDTIIDFLESPQLTPVIEFCGLKDFIIKSDKFRNRNIKDYLPELSNYLFGD